MLLSNRFVCVHSNKPVRMRKEGRNQLEIQQVSETIKPILYTWWFIFLGIDAISAFVG